MWILDWCFMFDVLFDDRSDSSALSEGERWMIGFPKIFLKNAVGVRQDICNHTMCFFSFSPCISYPRRISNPQKTHPRESRPSFRRSSVVASVRPVCHIPSVSKPSSDRGNTGLMFFFIPRTVSELQCMVDPPWASWDSLWPTIPLAFTFITLGFRLAYSWGFWLSKRSWQKSVFTLCLFGSLFFLIAGKT